MLHKIFLNIRSDFPREAFYQIFLPNDTVYFTSLSGLQEWLNSENPMVEIELDASHRKLQIGFRQQSTFRGPWIARPVEIDPRRAVLLTEEGEIRQIDPALLQMGRVSDANFLDNDTMRTAAGGVGKIAGLIVGKLVENSAFTETAQGILSGIPYAGIITALAGVIWPEPSVSSLINDAEVRMRNLIITKIREMGLANQRGGLMAVRNNLEEYRNALGSGRKRAMENALNSFNIVNGMILRRDQDYIHGSVYLALDLAGLHLGMLRERVMFEKEIYGDEAVNTQANIDTLVRRVEEYQEFFAHAIEREVEERMNQISISYRNTAGDITDNSPVIRIFLRDNVRREIHRFSQNGSFNTIIMNVPDPEHIKNLQFLIDLYKQQVENEIRFSLEEDINIPSQMLDWFIPGKENTRPVSLDDVFIVGPVTGLLNRDFNRPPIASVAYRSFEPGEIQIVQLVAMPGSVVPNFIFKTENNELISSMRRRLDDRTMVQFEKELSKDVFITRIESWWHHHPIAMRIHFSDGTDSGRIGESRDGELQSAGGNILGLTQGFMSAGNLSWKYGFRVMPSFYDL